jgi:hypothetical protein
MFGIGERKIKPHLGPGKRFTVSSAPCVFNSETFACDAENGLVQVCRLTGHHTFTEMDGLYVRHEGLTFATLCHI